MNGLPTGLYLPGTSPIHRLSALGKLLCLLLLLLAVVRTDVPICYGILLLFAAGAVLLSRLPASVIFAPAWRLKWFFLVIFLMNLCFFEPENPWFRLWIFQPSEEGLMQGVHVTARVFFLLVFSSLLTASTAPMEITDAIETLLTPLKLLRIPVAQIAMILSVAIQFIPTLFEQTDAIRKAQMARGARFDSKKLSQKAAAVLPLLTPIFLAAFQRADELSMAMEARGYRPQGAKNGRKKAGFHLLDIPALALCAALWVIQIIL